MSDKDIELGTLISDLKSKDKWAYNLIKAIVPIYIVCTILIVTLFIVENEYTTYRLIGIGLLLFSFGIIAITALKMSKEYKNIDYGIPITLMLRQAIRRHQILHPKSIYILIGVLLMAFSRIIEKYPFEDNADFINKLLFTQLPIVVGMVVGLVIGISMWHKNQKPIRDRARALLQELEG
ncbi:hypothetical protein EMN47_17995 [Prolixibacteraceae bacterium JC049]|nr:hypothetical protein [Prolixibacteraceae bacterium JC049]